MTIDQLISASVRIQGHTPLITKVCDKNTWLIIHTPAFLIMAGNWFYAAAYQERIKSESN